MVGVRRGDARPRRRRLHRPRCGSWRGPAPRSGRRGRDVLAYVTNNAARSPQAVADHLVQLGMRAAASDVVTSAQAAARLVAEAVPTGAPRVRDRWRRPLRGARGARADARAAHRRPTSGGGVGLPPGPALEDSHRRRDPACGKGVPWFASNTDLSVPTPHGPGPGNGVLVEAVARFAGVEPVVAGKPEPPLFHETHPPGRRRPAPRRRRPAGHRHRGGRACRLRQPAGHDRRDRAPRAGGGRAGPGRRTSR